MHHHLTVYGCNGKKWVESWLQINAFGKCFCFWKRKMELDNIFTSSESTLTPPIN